MKVLIIALCVLFSYAGLMYMLNEATWLSNTLVFMSGIILALITGLLWSKIDEKYK